ncbi:hypothetical protein M569_06455, partial [Genlisea aurea]
MAAGRAFAVIGLLLAVYCAVDPFDHSVMSGFPGFDVFKVETPARSEIPADRDSENRLQKSEIKFLKEVQGPESLAFDPMGRGPYTGVADGRILFWNGQKWSDFAYTSANRSGANCDERKASIAEYREREHICGRPLGLRFDKRNGDLYIADAYFGLMKVGPEGGLAASLVTEAEGVPLGFTNDLDIDRQGNVYFTDSSSNYRRRNYLQLLLSGDASGRVLKYDPQTNETRVLVRNLQFPNGISLSKDSASFFVYCELSRGRLSKYWLEGDRAGTWQVMAVLPGYPDNVRTNERGNFWVALHYRRSWYTGFIERHPELRKLWLKLPIPGGIHYYLLLGGRMSATVVQYDPQGEIVEIVEDGEGKVVRVVSEVEERDGKLWMGSVLMDFVAVYTLD